MELKGEFKKYLFHNKDNGYSVIIFYDEVDGEITCTGYLPELSDEFEYILQGEYVDHPKYGFQFRIDQIERFIDTNENSLINYFSSPQFKGIGHRTAKKIVDCLGKNAIEMIKKDHSCLDEIAGLNQNKKQAIIDGVNDDKAEIYFYLTSHHLSMKHIVRLENTYKNKMFDIVNKDPYRMVYEVSGIGFATADKFALDIGFKENDIQRLKALTYTFIVQLCVETGDSYVIYEDLIQKLLIKIGYENSPETIVQELIDQELLFIEEDRVYVDSQYEAENYIAQFLNYCPNKGFDTVDECEIKETLSNVEEELGIIYQEKQREAIETFFKNDVMVLTGGPGTGKTTIVYGMVELTKKLFPQYTINLAAPTGRAAKRLAELTQCEAKTIHSLLRWDKDTGLFAKNEDDPLNVDLLIIDEFSMVDDWLFYNLLRACSYVKKIVMIGDQDQLPSVGIGSLLRDVIESKLFKVVRLNKIYRQKDGSSIIQLASDIRENDAFDFNYENDVTFINCDQDNIKDYLLPVVSKAMNSFDDVTDGFYNVQVLAPKYKGKNGIDALNVCLQNQFNPPNKNKNELVVGYRTFRVGDKVLQLKNQPDDDVYNGDIGVIVDIIYAKDDFNGQNRIICDFDGIVVEYTSETFMDISLAYCMSIHKAQGSEYPIVIMPMSLEYGIMLQKRLLYTGITRANKSLVLIGQKDAFFKGINSKSFYHRNTTLKERLIKVYETLHSSKI